MVDESDVFKYFQFSVKIKLVEPNLRQGQTDPEKPEARIL